MATKSLSYQWKTSNIAMKLIVINVLIFLSVRIISWVMGFGNHPERLVDWFVLPADFSALILQVWGLLTYSFLHFGFWHIFWNMLMLYWFSSFVLNLFTEKRFLTIYLLGAICGGVLFVLAYNFFPVFQGQRGYLIGASAAVLSIVIFIASYTPQAEVRIFMFTLKLWHIGAFMIVGDLIQLPTSGNAGGLVAHMGGALFGYLYAVQLKKGKDIGAGFEKMMDSVVSLFSPKKKSPLKTVHKAKKTSSTVTRNTKSSLSKNKSADQVKIDAILDKISKSGYESLTKQEKDFLFKAGKE